MSTEHKYISERFERRTYIKGTFKGKFVGQLDRQKSDIRYERFFDIDILEGEIRSAIDNITRWTDGEEPAEFVATSTFRPRLPEKINVTLVNLDGSETHFKLPLRELKLINCRLSKQVYKDTEVFGTLEGDVSGFLLHVDTMVEDHPPVQEMSSTTENKGYQTQRDTDGKRRQTLRPEQAGQNGPQVSGDRNPLRSWLTWWLGVIIAAFVLIGLPCMQRYWPLWIIMFVLSGIFTPEVANNMDASLGLRLARKIRRALRILFAIVITSLLLVCCEKNNSNPLVNSERLIPKRKHLVNKDSFNLYYQEGQSQYRQRRYDQALINLEKASVYAPGNELRTLNSFKTDVLESVVAVQEKEEDFDASLKTYSELILLNAGDPKYYYKRAGSLLSLNRLKEAARDLKTAVGFGDKASELLYNKINPIKKRQIGTVTLCCDGTTSGAKGRGACSHHGGVCDWEHPLYEEYREFE